MVVEPYLMYDGRCEEAINFYKSALGAKVDMMLRYKDNADALKNAPQNAEKIMHSTIHIGDSVMHLSDGHCTGQAKFQGCSMSLKVPTPAEAEKVFKAVGEGGKVQMPLTKTFFSPSFGMVIDRFGLMWMVLAQ